MQKTEGGLHESSIPELWENLPGNPGGEVGVNELDLLLAPKGEEAIALSEICGGLTGVKCVACPWPFREEGRGTGGWIWVEGGKEAARSGLKRIKKKKKNLFNIVDR